MKTLEVPPTLAGQPEAIFDAFEAWVTEQGLELYPAQEEALLEVVSESNVIVSTPTGSGKSLIALGAHFAALANGRRSFYTAPLKALVSEKFFSLVDVFGARNVGMMTGDTAVNPAAPIICCTAEILANVALREGADADVAQVVMDEFHFYADPQRGWAWQVPLIELPQAQFILMSATLGNVSELAKDLTRRTGRPTADVTSTIRPVPLHFYYSTTPLHEQIGELLSTKQAPIYIVHFAQVAAIDQAQSLTSAGIASRSERDAIAEAIGGFRFSTGFGKVLSRLLRHGVGVHHAGMLPKYRRLVEQLAQQGLLKVICGTDTLGVGINVPIRTVLLTALTKFDGVRMRQLSVREFQQIAGRAGRAGYDDAGTVVVQAPEYVIENQKSLAKAGDDAKKRRKIVKKKAPEGFVSWGEGSFDRLVSSTPETLESHLTINHAMVLNLLARGGDSVAVIRHLLEDNHEPRRRQLALMKQAISIGRTLLTAGVLERYTAAVDGEPVVRFRVVAELQPNFALNQPLSPFALAVIDLLDPEQESYPLDVISVLEATLDEPRAVLRGQESLARGEAVAAMKAEGIEYEERMELLEDVTYPRPLAEMLDEAFAIYRQTQPWVSDFDLKPKSVVRDLYERAMTFTEFVSFYKLPRAEGAVLRYLADAYRTMRQTIPDDKKTPELHDLIDWIGELVRQVDSSLLEEWAALTDPGTDVPDQVRAPVPVETGVTANPRAFMVLVRNALFRRVDLAARRQYQALGELDAGDGWDAGRWAEAMENYFDNYDHLGTDAKARSSAMLIIEKGADIWQVRQIFADPEGNNDFGISAEVDLAESDEQGTAVVRVIDVNEI
ncbi:DUF3516 domain-containing protein [Saxibacter everestensis]|uniref:DUF3516 domain-containing protein n=1 Tax=Saxibacter everestensis TaxID=2909229 RepID=A0ABY8QXK0_9MICO|nr:DUF3516 domain-containing protein [Brevibacteriaceae bacterium ZFBP1038]